MYAFFVVKFWACNHQADSSRATQRTIFLQLPKSRMNQEIWEAAWKWLPATPSFLSLDPPKTIWGSSRSTWQSHYIFFQEAENNLNRRTLCHPSTSNLRPAG